MHEPSDECLRDAGCTEDFIQAYRKLEGDCVRRMAMLRVRREELLASLHQEQKRLECLDYLIYQWRKDGNIE